jgi:hypothetical protein
MAVSPIFGAQAQSETCWFRANNFRSGIAEQASAG